MNMEGLTRAGGKQLEQLVSTLICFSLLALPLYFGRPEVPLLGRLSSPPGARLIDCALEFLV
jgi:hypothetical protein